MRSKINYVKLIIFVVIVNMVTGNLVQADGNKITANVTEDSNIPVTGILLNKANMTVDYPLDSPDEIIKLEAIICPLDASNKHVLWSSSNKSIASVDINGTVTTTKKPGKTDIIAKTEDGNFKAVCRLVVKNKFYYSIKLYAVPKKNEFNWKKYSFKKKKLEVKKTFKIGVHNNPDVCSWGKLNYTFASSNNKVVKVNKEGVVTAKKPGKVTITVRPDSELYEILMKPAKCKIIVLPAKKHRKK